MQSAPRQVLSAATREKAAGERRRPIVGRVSAVAKALLPPGLFDPPEIETAFRANYALMNARRRRFGIFFALFVWVGFSVFDITNNPTEYIRYDIIAAVLSLRTAGSFAMIVGAVITTSRRFLDDKFANVMILLFTTACYFLLLAMVSNQEVPFTYVVDYPGLIIYVLGVVSLLRMRATTFLAFIGIVLPVTVYVLYNSNVISADAIGAWSQESLEHVFPATYRYFFVSSITYLTTAIAISYVITCRLERDARDTFKRERELERSNRTLEEARQDLEQSSAALIAVKDELTASAERANMEKSKFLADAVHDLSQPIQAVALFAESARHSLACRDLARSAGLIEKTGQAAQMARSSFRAVLEISRLKSGLVKPNLTAFKIQDAVVEAIAPLHVIADAQGVKIRMREGRDDRAMSLSDRTLLVRAITNLATNAVRYSDRDKGERQAVLIGIVVLSNYVRVDVIDNGIGIPKKKWSEVFKPFVQLHNPEHNREKGLGLGLSIVNAIFGVLPEHRLSLRSYEGRGTQFSLHIPRYLGAPVTLRETEASSASQDLSSLFIWHVEDDEIAKLATGAFLQELGALIEQAASFEEFEEKLRVSERRPDLLITDYRLSSGRTADDVIATLEKHLGADIPVIVLTGESIAKTTNTPPRNVEILIKPASPEEITGAIRRLCLNELSDLGAAE